MIKEHIDTRKLKMLAIDILDHVDSTEQFGHVGCYAIEKEEVEKVSKEMISLLEQAVEKFEHLSEMIKESYEY